MKKNIWWVCLINNCNYISEPGARPSKFTTLFSVYCLSFSKFLLTWAEMYMEIVFFYFILLKLSWKSLKLNYNALTTIKGVYRRIMLLACNIKGEQSLLIDEDGSRAFLRYQNTLLLHTSQIHLTRTDFWIKLKWIYITQYFYYNVYRALMESRSLK